MSWDRVELNWAMISHDFKSNSNSSLLIILKNAILKQALQELFLIQIYWRFRPKNESCRQKKWFLICFKQILPTFLKKRTWFDPSGTLTICGLFIFTVFTEQQKHRLYRIDRFCCIKLVRNFFNPQEDDADPDWQDEEPEEEEEEEEEGEEHQDDDPEYYPDVQEKVESDSKGR